MRQPAPGPRTRKPASADAPPQDRNGNGWLELVSERAQGKAQSAADGLDRFIENRIEDVLNRVNIPSRSDIERLNRSVDILTTKVEALLNRHERSGH